MTKRFEPLAFMLPLLGVGVVLLIWTILSQMVAPDLPSPLKTWNESQTYILRPFFKDGEMNQGIARFAGLSLLRVAKGFSLAIAVGMPLGFLLGLSASFHRAFDPVIQVLRPISPLAWLPLGLVIVASEMLTGAPGVGGFLWQEYNSLVYSHILLSIITIGVIGFLLDRLMGMIERKFKTA
jgi:ABC-type nitrate/sulfonate/bicarbonate transport system permease component